MATEWSVAASMAVRQAVVRAEVAGARAQEKMEEVGRVAEKAAMGRCCVAPAVVLMALVSVATEPSAMDPDAGETDTACRAAVALVAVAKGTAEVEVGTTASAGSMVVRWVALWASEAGEAEDGKAVDAREEDPPETVVMGVVAGGRAVVDEAAGVRAAALRVLE